MTAAALTGTLLATGYLAFELFGISCSTCETGNVSIALIGTLFYSGITLTAMLRWRRLLEAMLGAACGGHTGFVIIMFIANRYCSLCFAVFCCSLVAIACFTWRIRLPRWRFAMGFGFSAPPVFLCCLPILALLREPEPIAGHTIVVVYERESCSSCEQFRARIDPAIRSFRHLTVEYRDAASLSPWIRHTPTVIVLCRESRSIIRTPLDLDEVLRAIKRCGY